jgi:SSS family solute:Na+ symporter
VFIGLLSTVAIALFMMFFGLRHTFLGTMHFLYMAPVNFALSMAIMIIVSLFTQKPPKEKTEGYTLTREFFKEESTTFKTVKWYRDFRLWAILLVIFSFTIMFLYR